MPRLVRLAALGWRVLGFAVLATTILALLAIGIGPRTGAYQVRTVLTGSMRPTIPEGSLVVVTPVRLSDLRVDDVITYRIPAEDRRIVTHRIVEIKVSGDHPVVVTKGDANRDRDPWVAHLRGDRAWRASLSVPKVAFVLELLRRPALRLATVLVAPALLAVVSLVNIWAPPKPAQPDETRPARRQPATRARPLRPDKRRRRWRRPRSTAKRAEPALSDQERWQQWRERRVHQRPIRWTPDE